MLDHGHDHDEHAEVHQLRRIADELEKIHQDLQCICNALQPLAATDFKLAQLKGDSPMSITGIQAGASAAFQILLVPGNAAALQSGPTAVSDDPKVTVGPNPSDPTNPFMITCAVAADDTALSFNLKVDGVNSLGNAITHTFAIPILQAPPPAAVDFDLDQLQVTPLAKTK